MQNELNLNQLLINCQGVVCVLPIASCINLNPKIVSKYLSASDGIVATSGIEPDFLLYEGEIIS